MIDGDTIIDFEKVRAAHEEKEMAEQVRKVVDLWFALLLWPFGVFWR